MPELYGLDLTTSLPVEKGRLSIEMKVVVLLPLTVYGEGLGVRFRNGSFREVSIPHLLTNVVL
jgi:hypothetical protein